MRLGPRRRKGTWKIGSPKACEGRLQPLAITLDTLHSVVCRTEIAEIDPLNDEAMLAAVAKVTTPEIARQVMAILRAHWSTNDTEIIRFRAGIVHSLSDLAYYCPVIEWLEKKDVEVVAMFNIDNTKCYSWLAHYGQRNEPSGKDGQRWRDTWVHWGIESMDCLRILFEASQNLAGILQWTTKDIVRLYCRVAPEEKESDEE
jgi:hypothetical protein